ADSAVSFGKNYVCTCEIVVSENDFAGIDKLRSSRCSQITCDDQCRKALAETRYQVACARRSVIQQLHAVQRIMQVLEQRYQLSLERHGSSLGNQSVERAAMTGDNLTPHRFPPGISVFRQSCASKQLVSHTLKGRNDDNGRLKARGLQNDLTNL